MLEINLIYIHSEIFNTIIEEQFYLNKDDESELNVLRLVIMQIVPDTILGMNSEKFHFRPEYLVVKILALNNLRFQCIRKLFPKILK